MQISELKDEEIPAINALIRLSKSHWRQDPDYLKKALALLAIDHGWIQSKRGYALYDKELIGFLGYEEKEDFWLLEHLWILPTKIGLSFGRQAVAFLLDKARLAEINKISLWPEPCSERFYEKMGAVYTGLTVPSRIENGPLFKEMAFDI
jgi:hypothetical protein